MNKTAYFKSKLGQYVHANMLNIPKIDTKILNIQKGQNHAKVYVTYWQYI